MVGAIIGLVANMMNQAKQQQQSASNVAAENASRRRAGDLSGRTNVQTGNAGSMLSNIKDIITSAKKDVGGEDKDNYTDTVNKNRQDGYSDTYDPTTNTNMSEKAIGLDSSEINLGK
jgi:hypothetical protein